MNLTTKETDDISVRKGRRGSEPHDRFVELLTEDSQYILTPEEAECLGNALIKAAQSKQKKDAPTEAQKEQRCERS